MSEREEVSRFLARAYGRMELPSKCMRRQKEKILGRYSGVQFWTS